MSNSHRLTTISVSRENYLNLKKLGGAGDSFNDVISRIFEQLEAQRKEKGIRTGDYSSPNSQMAENPVSQSK